MPDIRLVVGLGNPGPRYRGTRHNVGFDVLDALSQKLDTEPPRAVADSQVWRAGHLLGGELYLVKPLTFMNLSGEVLRQFRNKPWYGPGAVLACYDDIDLPLGQLRIRLKGSAGGHKGMLSLIQHLGSEEIARVRVGIGPVPPAVDAAEFVLARFTPAERAVLDDGVARAAQSIEAALSDGVEPAMNKYNQKAKA